MTAAAADALAVAGGFLLAIWLRFFSGWFTLHPSGLPSLAPYLYGAGVATLLFLFLFQAFALYRRPQAGSFGDKIPRLIRACGTGILLASVLAFAVQTQPPFSRLTVGLALFTVTALILLERSLLFYAEIALARRRPAINRLLILGTGPLAARLKDAFEDEPRLRSRVVGFLQIGPASSTTDAAMPGLVAGTLDELDRFLEPRSVDQVVLADTSLDRASMADLILRCERALVRINLVPDLFEVLTRRVEVETIAGVPLLHFSRWPLDFFWNRLLKRLEDIVGSAIGLVLSAPVIAVAALAIRRESPGPVFYRQPRCGEDGRCFTLNKLRTMRTDAEAESGPVWAKPDDPRCTQVGAFLRRHNLDELPQFWNVLRGDMSLVGPRPERPFFVEQFREEIGRYMWRHASKPGMTGWAQVNGLRGQTSIQDRIEYDLYYLENWSLALDFKILMRTFGASRNAY